MNEQVFWKIIKRAKSEADGDVEGIAEGVYEQLVELSPHEIESFQAILDSKLADAYTYKLWGAAYLMNGGCSDDGFDYFRAWLVAQGQNTYEAALADPDSLAKIADSEEDDNECEALLSVALSAYKDIEGKEMPSHGKFLPRPTGEPWDFDDDEATQRQLPKLYRKLDTQ